MVATISLPEHLENHPWLFQAYVDNEYNIRGMYRGEVGWFAEDSADLHPPTMEELGGVMVDGFGGADKLIASARKAYEEKKYNLTAKLLSYMLAVEPENPEARQLKADALRAMAQSTHAGIQARGFLLSQALHLEGKIDWTAPPSFAMFGLITKESILATPAGTYLKLLETKIDPEKSANLDNVVKVTFTDLQQSWGLYVRHGVAEVTENAPEQSDVTLELPRSVWAQIFLGETTPEGAIASGEASFKGSEEVLTAVFSSFDYD
jgi:alkyl sulfatase BDS1-like metallo-beta-lactamase superfamily hydrolase